ncbi:MAG TPA: glycosyltransferase [Acidobacteriota bacterium]|nr:glycosyltransferase [Acidobacteriota bacterium]
MNVVLLSDFETYGGAAIATSRLAQALSDTGHQVTRIVAHEDGNQHSWKTISLDQNRSFLHRIGTKYKENRSLRHLANLLESIGPDVINVHNIHGALTNGWSIDFLSTCQKYAPTIWTLHDMWSFTGRCAYSYDCKKFIDGCDETCPTPEEYPALTPEKIKPAWLKRSQILVGSGFTCVTPSKWMAAQAAAGMWRDARIEVIPNGLPLELYSPVERTHARKELGIDSHGIVMITVAQDFSERRKGGNYLQQTLNRITDQNLTLVVMGEGKVNLSSPKIKIHSLGFVKEDRIKVLAYSSADFLIHTAPVDNLPNVITEAFACGTPTVAFQTGGVSELVRPGVTGWLANEINEDSLCNAVQIASREILAGMDLSQSCRDVAVNEYSLPMEANRYSALFEQLMQRFISAEQ